MAYIEWDYTVITSMVEKQGWDLPERDSKEWNKFNDDTLYNEDLGEIKGNFSNIDIQGRDQVDLLIQPEDLEHDDKSKLKFDVVDKKFRGSSFIYILKTHSNLMLPVFVHSHHEHLHQENEKFGIKQPIYIDHLVCF